MENKVVWQATTSYINHPMLAQYPTEHQEKSDNWRFPAGLVVFHAMNKHITHVFALSVESYTPR